MPELLVLYPRNLIKTICCLRDILEFQISHRASLYLILCWVGFWASERHHQHLPIRWLPRLSSTACLESSLCSRQRWAAQSRVGFCSAHSPACMSVASHSSLFVWFLRFYNSFEIRKGNSSVFIYQDFSQLVIPQELKNIFYFCKNSTETLERHFRESAHEDKHLKNITLSKSWV